MWIKLLGGAVLGFIVGYFVPPGYPLWVILGVIAGYLWELWVSKEKREKDEDEK